MEKDGKFVSDLPHIIEEMELKVKWYQNHLNEVFICADCERKIKRKDCYGFSGELDKYCEECYRRRRREKIFIHPKSICNTCSEEKDRCEFLSNQPETEEDYTLECANHKIERNL